MAEDQPIVQAPAEATATTDAGIDYLSDSVLTSFYEPLKSLSTHLEEIEQSQFGWLSKIQYEANALQNVDSELKDLISLFSKLPEYLAKVQRMKKDMQSMSSKVKSMHNSAVKLKEKKIKDELAQQEKDQKLLAQPAKSLPTQAPAPSPPPPIAKPATPDSK